MLSWLFKKCHHIVECIPEMGPSAKLVNLLEWLLYSSLLGSRYEVLPTYAELPFYACVTVDLLYNSDWARRMLVQDPRPLLLARESNKTRCKSVRGSSTTAAPSGIELSSVDSDKSVNIYYQQDTRVADTCS